MKKEKRNKKTSLHPNFTHAGVRPRAESGCVDVHTTYSIHVHVHVPMYEVDRVYGLTESGKNLSLSLSLLARVRMGGIGGAETGQLNTQKMSPYKNELRRI